jgi:phage shock protein E
MRCWKPIVAVCGVVVMPLAHAVEPEAIHSQSGPSQVAANPAIDVASYLRVSRQALERRETHRLTERDFIRMSREPGTVVLDARSREKFDLLHVRGAINLSFPDIAVGSLEDALPDKDVRILIYCNNNFRNAEDPFPSKLPSASLNISTYIALYDYGYRNVYELGPQLDIDQSALEFESSQPPPR